MKNYDPTVRVETDKDTGSILAVYLRLRAGRVDETREFCDGKVLADYGANGELLGVELIGACRIDLLVDRVARREPEEVRAFLRNVVPRQMAIGA